MYTLRDYQAEAKDSILAEWDEGHQRTLLVLPTGCGKTVVFASVIEEQVKKGHRVLVMAHRDELLQQAADKLMNASGIDCAFEKAEQTSLGDPHQVVVGSVQRLSMTKRLSRFPRDHFDDIVVDEAHHCLSVSYRKVLDHFNTANVLGVTATPDRSDQKNLGDFFDSKAYEYSMIRAIRDGYLCRVKAQMIPLPIDIKSVSISKGDYAAEQIGTALDPYLDRIAQEMAHYCKGRKTVVFLPLIATSQRLCAILNEVGLRAAEVNGKSENRSEVLDAFERGEYDVLCNSMLLTEGWDCPSVDCIVILRPTKIRSLYQQMVGRGMRLSPGKDHLLLLDFLWMTEKHNLCRPSTLLCKSEEVAQKMNERLERDDAIYDIIEAEEQAERDCLAERENALAAKLKEQRNKHKALVDPMQYSLSIVSVEVANYEPVFAWERKPPTEKQKATLEKFGIDPEDVDCAGLASKIIHSLIDRRAAGLATPKQIRTLERFGFQHVGTWPSKHASKIIGRIAERGWTLPYDFDPASYRPKGVA